MNKETNLIDIIDKLHTVKDLNEYITEYSVGSSLIKNQDIVLGILHKEIESLLTEIENEIKESLQSN